MFSGDLKDLNLADLLQSLQQNGRTGTLTLEGAGEDHDRIRLEAGKISAVAVGGRAQDSFADVLRRTRIVPENDLQRALKKKGKKNLRQVLQDLGLLDPEKYREAAELYIRDLTCDLFLKPHRKFDFAEGAEDLGLFDPDLRTAGAGVDPQGLILEGGRRQDEWSRLSRRIGGMEEVYVGGESTEGASLTAEGLELLQALDGRRSLSECARVLPFGRFRTLEALGELLDARIARPATADELAALADRAERASDAEAAVGFYKRALEIARNALPLRERLAELLERTGRREDAAAERKLLGFARAAAGDLAGAAADYLRAADLSPDPVALERAFELTRSRREEAAAISIAKRLAEMHVKSGLPERAKAVYTELLRDHPDDDELAERFAETVERMGEKREAAATWKKIGKRREARDDTSGAAEAYRRAMGADAQDEEAKLRLDDLNSGRRAARARAFRRARWIAFAAALAGCTVVAGVREMFARTALHGAHEAALFNRTVEWDRAHWIEAYRNVAKAYPFTIFGAEARRLADGLEEYERSGSAAAPTQPRQE